MAQVGFLLRGPLLHPVRADRTIPVREAARCHFITQKEEREPGLKPTKRISTQKRILGVYVTLQLLDSP